MSAEPAPVVPPTRRLRGRRRSGLLSRVRPEVLFLPVFVLVGLVFVLIVPPGWNADEPAHAFRASSIADGQVLPTVRTPETGQTEVGGTVPNDLVALFALNRVLANDAVFRPDYKVDHLYTHRQERQAKRVTGEGFMDFRNTALYSPVAYLPELPAFWVGRVLDLEPATVVRLARVFSLLAVGLMFVGAIRWAPRGKWVLAVFGLLPSVVTQSAALSADGMVLGLGALLVAALLWAVDDTDGSDVAAWRVLWPFVLLAGLLGLAKIAYAPLAALVLVVPLCRTGLRHRRGALWAVAAFVVAMVPALVWARLTSSANVSLNATADLSEQESRVLHDPIGFVEVIGRTFFDSGSSQLALSAFGDFIWLTAPLPALFVLLAAVGLWMSRYLDDPRETDSGGGSPLAVTTKRGELILGGWMLLVALGTALVIALGIYVTFTPVGSPRVDGLTGRYFLPVLLVVLLAFRGIGPARQRALRIAVPVIALLALVSAVTTVWGRLYG